MTMTWDEIPVGAVTGTIDFTVTDEMIDEYLEAIEMDQATLDALDDEKGARIAPVDLVPKMAMRTLFIDYMFEHIGPSVRVKQGYKLLQPIRVGTHVSATGRISEKYEKRGKNFVAFEATFVDDAGIPLLIDKRAVMVLGGEAKIKG